MEKDNRHSLFKMAHPPKIMLKFFKSIKPEAFLLTFDFSDKTLHSLNTWKAILHFFFFSSVTTDSSNSVKVG